MKKIILGYERYDPVTGEGKNFNGRLEPTTKKKDSKDVIINDFYERYYCTFISPETCSSEMYRKSHGSFFGDGISDFFIDRKQIDSIINKTYFYPIEILHMGAFIKCTSHISISHKVREDVINGKAYLIIRYLSEGDMSYYISEFNQLIKNLNLPKERILVFHGDLSIEKYKKCDFTYIPVNSFPFWLAPFKRDAVTSYNPDKLYLSYNRNPRAHRLVLTGLLLKADMIKHGIYSFCVSDKDTIKNINNNILSGILTDDEISFMSVSSGVSPDNLNLRTENPAVNIVEEHYETTFCSLVTETLDDTIFLTEKIYKPILMGHPFVVLGSKDTLSYLRKLGFKTFSNWWDESYDFTDNLVERCNKIVDIMVKLSKKDPKQLRLIRGLMKPILKHNQEVFNKIISDTRFGVDLELVKYIERLI